MVLQGAYALTDHVQLIFPAPSVVYREGERGSFEWAAWAGMWDAGFGYTHSERYKITGIVGTGADLRWWTASTQRLYATARIGSSFRWTSHSGNDPRLESFGLPTANHGISTWFAHIGIGYSITVAELVTFNLGISLQCNFLYEGGLPHNATERGLTLASGTAQAFALRPLPLIQVQLGRYVAIELEGTLAYDWRSLYNELYPRGALAASFVW